MKIKRHFQPLDGWLYLKIYMNPRVSDLALTRYIFPALHDIEDKLETKWFFIRYSDPTYHIRLRIWLPQSKARLSALGKLRKLFKSGIEDGYIHKWLIDTYVREIERYGEDNMASTESIFHIDSILMENILTSPYCNSSTLDKVSLWLMNDTMECFGMTLDDRIEFCTKRRDGYMNEMRLDNKSFKIMNKQYNKFKTYLFAISSSSPLGLHISIKNKMDIRHLRLNGLLANMHSDRLTSFNIGAIIHLAINRVYQLNARKAECILYHILLKHYIADKNRFISSSSKMHNKHHHNDE